MNRRKALQKAAWHCSARLNQLKTAQIVAVSLIALWGAFFITIDYPLLRQTQRMAMQLKSIPATMRNRPAQQSTDRHDTAKDFAAALPYYDTYPDQLRDLNALADKNGVVITRIDYQYETLAVAPIKRLVMRMATTGVDVQQQRFLQTMLNTFPNLSVARLAWSKALNDSTKAEQKLDVHLYYRIRTAA